MSAGEIRGPDAATRAELEKAESQLALYARDLRRMVDSERKKARELAEANARLRILGRLKTDFLVFISHSLRTPLHALSMLEWLETDSWSRDQRDQIEILRRAYQRLEDFIRRGLEYFGWLAEETAVAASRADLSVVLEEAVRSVPDLAGPGVTFQPPPPGARPAIRGNEAHLSEVVRILLENALKFSPSEKRITLAIGEDGERVRLVVADRGVGLPAEMAKEIFEPFTILDIDHHGQGTGLSLALAKAIVEGHGGRLWAESEGPGLGSRFIVDLPRIPEAAPEAARSVRDSSGPDARAAERVAPKAVPREAGR